MISDSVYDRLTLAAGVYELSMMPVFRVSELDGEARVNIRVLIKNTADDSDIDDQSSIGYLRGFGGVGDQRALSQHLFSLASETAITIGVAESGQGTDNPVYRTIAGGFVNIKRFA